MAEEQEIQEPRPKKQKRKEVIEYWLDPFSVMFVSLSMILLAFFIALNSIAVPDKVRERAALGSLLGSFGILPDGVGVDEKGAYMTSVEHLSLKNEVILFQNFQAYVDEEFTKEEVETYIDEEGRRRIRFSDQFLFPSGSFNINPKVFRILNQLGIILKRLGRPIEVEGHTDAAKGHASNWELSAMRAVAVIRYFEETRQLSSKQLTAVGFGAARPRHGTKAALKNRRVEIVVY